MNQRQPRIYRPGFLAFVRTKPCCVCGAVGRTEAAHCRIGHLAMGMKPDDAKCTPLCSWCHREGSKAQHRMNEEEFWRLHGLDPFAIAADLFAEYGKDDGKTRGPRKIKPRPPKNKRAKIASRPDAWPKGRGFGK